jgi:hypothetical protein
MELIPPVWAQDSWVIDVWADGTWSTTVLTLPAAGPGATWTLPPSRNAWKLPPKRTEWKV